jgi:hypothetical protein
MREQVDEAPSSVALVILGLYWRMLEITRQVLSCRQHQIRIEVVCGAAGKMTMVEHELGQVHHVTGVAAVLASKPSTDSPISSLGALHPYQVRGVESCKQVLEVHFLHTGTGDDMPLGFQVALRGWILHDELPYL